MYPEQINSYNREDAHYSAFSADDDDIGMHTDSNAMGFTEDPIEK